MRLVLRGLGTRTSDRPRSTTAGALGDALLCRETSATSTIGSSAISSASSSPSSHCPADKSSGSGSCGAPEAAPSAGDGAG